MREEENGREKEGRRGIHSVNNPKDSQRTGYKKYPINTCTVGLSVRAQRFLKLIRNTI